MDINNRYKELLLKFAGNAELLELFDLALLDDIRIREMYYEKNKKYPDQRDMLGKLRTDLYTVKKCIRNM